MKITIEEIENFHSHNLWIKKRIIYIGSESRENDGEETGTDAFMAERFLKNMAILENESIKPITIIMNNPGGDIHDGMGIYDRIKASPCHITIKVYGEASSMGSIILQSGDHRIMSKGSVQLIHYGSFEVNQEAKSAYKFVEEFKRIDKLMEKIYMDRIKKKNPAYKIGRLKYLLSHDSYLTAEQSLELGLIDEIEQYAKRKR